MQSSRFVLIQLSVLFDKVRGFTGQVPQKWCIDHSPSCSVFLPRRTFLTKRSFQFRLLKEGEEVTCGAKDSHTQQLWVNALYRATGQTTRPEKSDHLRGNDVNDIRKAGLDMLISKEPCKLDQV